MSFDVLPHTHTHKLSSSFSQRTHVYCILMYVYNNNKFLYVARVPFCCCGLIDVSEFSPSTPEMPPL